MDDNASKYITIFREYLFKFLLIFIYLITHPQICYQFAKHFVCKTFLRNTCSRSATCLQHDSDPNPMEDEIATCDIGDFFWQMNQVLHHNWVWCLCALLMTLASSLYPLTRLILCAFSLLLWAESPRSTETADTGINMFNMAVIFGNPFICEHLSVAGIEFGKLSDRFHMFFPKFEFLRGFLIEEHNPHIFWLVISSHHRSWIHLQVYPDFSQD